MFQIEQFDHVGIRVSDIVKAQAFYAKLGFRADPQEESPKARARGLINDHGLRIHLIYNADGPVDANPLMDVSQKLPGYTHAAFIVDDLDKMVDWLTNENIKITEGPSVFGNGRRKVCFIRDPDLNVLEFNQVL